MAAGRIRYRRALATGVAGLALLAIAAVAGISGARDVPVIPERPQSTATVPPSELVRLHSEAPGKSGDATRAFVKPDGTKVTLNGFNVFPLWPDPPRVAFGPRHYREIAAKGFNAVRFVLPWSVYEPTRGRFEHLEELDRAIAYARAAGLYVVLLNIVIDRWNSPPGWTTGLDKIDSIGRDARGWTQELARRYRDEPAVAAYDLAAELPSTDQNRLLRTYSAMIDWVRAVDPRKIVVVTAGWGSSAMTPDFAVPASLRQRHNVVFGWHDYFAGDGHPDRTFAGYDALTGRNAGNQVWDGVSGYPSGADESDFRAQIEANLDWGRRAGLAVWVAEYGINTAAINAGKWIAQKVALYDRAGLSRMWWLYKCEDEGMAPRGPDCHWKPSIEGLR